MTKCIQTTALAPLHSTADLFQRSPLSVVFPCAMCCHSSCTGEPQHIVSPVLGEAEEGVVPISPSGKHSSCQGDSQEDTLHPCTDMAKQPPARLTLPLRTAPGPVSHDRCATPTSMRRGRETDRRSVQTKWLDPASQQTPAKWDEYTNHSLFQLNTSDSLTNSGSELPTRTFHQHKREIPLHRSYGRAKQSQMYESHCSTPLITEPRL